MTKAAKIIERVVGDLAAKKVERFNAEIERFEEPEEFARHFGLPNPTGDSVEEELFPIRLALKQMGSGMVASVFGIGHGQIQALTGSSKPAAEVAFEKSAELLIEEMFENYPGAAGRYFSRPGSVEAVVPERIVHSLYSCEDGSLILRIEKDRSGANDLIGKVLAEARGLEDLSEDFKKNCQEGIKELMGEFEDKLESREARRRLPGLIEGFFLDIARDAAKGDGTSTLPIESMEKYAAKTMGKLADEATRKWKAGVVSVSLDGSPAEDLTALRFGLGVPESISMKDALARRKAAEAVNSAPGSASAPKPAN